MKRFGIVLLSLCLLAGVAYGAPDVDTGSRGVYVVDLSYAGLRVYDKQIESGLTVYVPLSDESDGHNGLAPKVGVNTFSYGTFSRSSTGYYTSACGRVVHAAVNEPRYAYRSGRIGLLLEPASVNQCKHSTINSEWSAFKSGVTLNAVMAPDGTMRAAELYENNENDQHHTYYSIGQPFPQDSNVTYSCYAKANTRSWVRLLVKTYQPEYWSAFFDLSNGVVGALSSGTSNAGIEPIGNGWYRCWMTLDTDIGATSSNAYVGLASADNTPSYQGDGESSIYVWGYQAEGLSYPTSYIETSAVTAIRSGELAVPEYDLPDQVFDGDSAVGTVTLLWCPLFDYDFLKPNTYQYGVLSAKDGSAASLLRMHNSNGAAGRITSLDDAATAPYANVDWEDGTWHKLVVKFGYLDSGQSKFAVGYDNGGGITWGTPLDFITYDTTGGKLQFMAQVSVAPYLVRDLRIYDRVLSDSEIQQLGW